MISWFWSPAHIPTPTVESLRVLVNVIAEMDDIVDVILTSRVAVSVEETLSYSASELSQAIQVSSRALTIIGAREHSESKILLHFALLLRNRLGAADRR